ncbi:N-formylglutamate amidohydrolase [Bradyrhizobium sp. SZCCHNRI3043]|uniref:N-formylglutamate amidohydrolase n=1 Tax=Bradyrhizobium sp. SZCCHNRI3043 TaxID=3057292 RepID=UPI0028E4081B|nr:N-formylglutamate amidohydrolase [Bradyrhizobium sp. SZCCHNRI3043]
MTVSGTSNTHLLLQPDEVPPVLERNAGGASALLFTCDHYGRLLPRALGDLGLPEGELERHIAWDIGIAEVAEQVSRALDARLVAQRYSRLVIDCNRSPKAPNSIPMISERTTIPGNEGLTHEDAELRRRVIFDPYHDRITDVLDARKAAGRPTILVSLHSFTPVYAGIARPWHIGTLYQHDRVLPPLLLKALRAEPDLVVGDNQPYAVGDSTDYTIPVHGEARGLINSGIEIRQNEIAEPEGQQRWAERLIRILGEIEVELRRKGLA